MQMYSILQNSVLDTFSFYDIIIVEKNNMRGGYDLDKYNSSETER